MYFDKLLNDTENREVELSIMEKKKNEWLPLREKK